MASPASSASRSAENGSGAASGTPGSRPVVDVTAVTTRDDFLLELGEALGGQAAIRPVDSTALALEHLSTGKRAHVLVVDTRDVADVRDDLERAHAQAPHAVVVVFGPPESEKQLATALKGTNVFAVLTTPFDKRKTAAVLEGALSEAVSRTAPAPKTPERSSSVTVEPYQAAPGPIGTPSDSGSGTARPMNKALLIGAAVAVVAVAAGGYFLFGRSKPARIPAAALPVTPTQPQGAETKAPPEEGPAPAQPPVETSLVNGKLDELLEKARQAMRERRYSEPTGDNALLYYRSAAAADPTNGEAADGLQRVAGVLATRFDEAVNAGRLDEASLALANLKSALPSDPRGPAFELRLTSALIVKAFTDGNLERAAGLIRQAQQSNLVPADQIARWRLEMSRRQEDAKVQRAATLVSDRIRDGRLLDPAEDSAKVYMQQLHEVAPSNATTQRLARELNAAYLRKAREAAQASRSAEADRYLTEARANGVSASELTAFQRDLSSSRQRAVSAETDRLTQLARDRIRDGRLTDPANDSAAFYLGQISSTDAPNANLAIVSHDLAGHLIERARTAAQSGKGAAAEADLVQAKRWGGDPKDILAVQQLESAPKTSAGATARASTASNAALAANLKRTRYVAPEFPSRALSENQAGSVTLEYVVGTKGDTRDIRVIESTPPGLFDKAAVSAVKRWHYDPVYADGVPVEVPVRTAIRFELPK